MNSGKEAPRPESVNQPTYGADRTHSDSPVVEIERLHHLSVEASDWRATTAFYELNFGFRRIPRPPFRFEGSWLERGSLQIHVIQGRPPERGDSISTTADHWAFRVPCLESAKRALTARGVPFRTNIQSGTGIEQVFLHDPDGNTIEIGAYPETIEIRNPT